ncbi:MAG: RnfABCDGE type electron transport complex subunit D [Kiritimatiellae bacterium]|nr:RnfABCDGE type electron transport complex subunit D [Kiritimatiellia bacterium]
MDLATKTVPWVKWQAPMVRVLRACVPLAVASVYFFGWRALAVLLVSNAFAYLAERMFTRSWKEPVSSAVFVTGTLLAFSLPPPIPLWMAALGAVFGIVFGKMVFGGFGRNVFNPALTGRAFLYISFGRQMTGQWYEPFTGWPGGLAEWGYTAASAPVDAITTATPGALMKLGQEFGFWELFLGDCSGVIGGTSAILTIICGAYLLWTKTANYRIVVSGFVGFLLMQTLAWQAGWHHAVDPLRAACGGSLVIGVLFYATDPISASGTNPGRWIYGAFIGAMSSLIATFSAWPAGTMFAILLANMFAPIMDHAIHKMTQKPAIMRDGGVKRA